MSVAPGYGVLYVVATPIGNLEDLSRRTLRVLSEADVVCCEDTRHTGQLLAREQVVAHRLISLHEHNESSRIEMLLEELAAGNSVALVSDAGTPLLSDPGGRLVAAVADAGFTVQAVPGPSALLAALVVTGFELEHFSFEGFLPRKGSERAARLATIALAPFPFVIYESPLRIGQTVRDLVASCGDERRVAICRELTKLHEETWRGPLAQAIDSPVVKAARGEYVIVVDGCPPSEVPAADELAPLFLRLAEAGLARRDAIAAVEILLGVAHRAAYDAALAVGRGGDGARSS